MKHLLTFCAMAALGIAPLLASSPKEPRGPNGGHSQARMLNHLLSMEQQELTELRKTIERIEKMSPEEREHLRTRIGKMQKLPPERVEAMRERFEAIPQETREAMREKWLTMTPEERRNWRQKLRQMPPEERAKVFDEQGFIPVMGRDPEKRPKSPRLPPE